MNPNLEKSEDPKHSAGGRLFGDLRKAGETRSAIVL